MGESGERELVRRCIEGEGAAWEELVRRTAATVMQSAARTLRRFGVPPGAAQVEEVALEVYSRLWEEDRRRLKGFRGESSLESFLSGFTRVEALHLATLWKRKAERERSAPIPQAAPSSSEALERSELKESVRSALASLEEEDRRLFLLLYEENRTYRQASRILGIPWTTLADRTARIKEKLREWLEGRIFCL